MRLLCSFYGLCLSLRVSRLSPQAKANSLPRARRSRETGSISAEHVQIEQKVLTLQGFHLVPVIWRPTHCPGGSSSPSERTKARAIYPLLCWVLSRSAVCRYECVGDPECKTRRTHDDGMAKARQQTATSSHIHFCLLPLSSAMPPEKARTCRERMQPRQSCAWACARRWRSRNVFDCGLRSTHHASTQATPSDSCRPSRSRSAESVLARLF